MKITKKMFNPIPMSFIFKLIYKNSGVFKSSPGALVKFISSTYVVNIANPDSYFFMKTHGYII